MELNRSNIEESNPWEVGYWDAYCGCSYRNPYAEGSGAYSQYDSGYDQGADDRAEERV